MAYTTSLKISALLLSSLLLASSLYAPVYTDPAIAATPQQTHLLSSSSLINVVPWRGSTLQNPRSGPNHNSMLALNRRSSSYTPKAVLDVYSHNASNPSFKLPSMYMQRYGERESFMNFGADGHWVLQTGHDRRGEMYLQPGGGYIQIGQNSSQNNRGSSDPLTAASAYHTTTTLNVHAKAYFHDTFRIKNAGGTFVDIIPALDTLSAITTTLTNNVTVTRRVIDRDDPTYVLNPNEQSVVNTLLANSIGDPGDSNKILDLSGSSRFNTASFQGIDLLQGTIDFYNGGFVRQELVYVDGQGTVFRRPASSDSAMSAFNFESNVNLKNTQTKKLNISPVVATGVTHRNTENGIYFNEHPVLTANDSASDIWLNPSLTRANPPTFRRVNIGAKGPGYTANTHQNSNVFNAFGQMASFGHRSLNTDGTVDNIHMVDPLRTSTMKHLVLRGDPSQRASDAQSGTADLFLNSSETKHGVLIHRTKSGSSTGKHSLAIYATKGTAQVAHIQNETRGAGLKVWRTNVDYERQTDSSAPLVEIFDDRHPASGRRNNSALHVHNRDPNIWTAAISNHGAGPHQHNRPALVVNGKLDANGLLTVHGEAHFRNSMRSTSKFIMHSNIPGTSDGNHAWGSERNPADTVLTVMNSHGGPQAYAAHFVGRSSNSHGTHRGVVEVINTSAGGPAIRAVNYQRNGWDLAMQTADTAGNRKVGYHSYISGAAAPAGWRSSSISKDYENAAIIALNQDKQGHGMSAFTVGTKEALIAHSNGNTGIFSIGDVKTSSSIRWKTNIKRIQNPIDKVKRLEGVTFTRKDKLDKSTQMGLIAERVGEVIPEVVDYEENGVDAKSVAYGKLTALLIEAVKEQQATIEAMQREIDALKAQH